MKSLIITSVIAIVMFCLVSEIKINFSPFKISFGAVYSGIGLLFLLIGVFTLNFKHYKDGYKKGYENCYKNCMEIINQKSE